MIINQIYNRKQIWMFTRNCSLKWYYISREFTLIIIEHLKDTLFHWLNRRRNFKELIETSRSEEWKFIRSINTSSRTWQYLILYGGFRAAFFFATKVGPRFARKNSAMLWTGKSSDEAGVMEIITEGEFTRYSRFTERVRSIILGPAVWLTPMYLRSRYSAYKNAKYLYIWKKRVSFPSNFCFYIADTSR